MSQHLSRYTLGAAFLFVWLGPVAAQEPKPIKRAVEDYRQFFKKPEKPMEFWAAMKFEIEVGRYDLAAEDLKGFIASKPSKEDLLQIENEEGMSGFLRLLTFKELRQDAKPLLDRVSQVVKEHRSDPDRIKRFVDNLNASPEERAYALGQLRQSGAAAVPYLIEALQASAGADDHARLLTAMLHLTPDIVPPILAALDMEDATLKTELIDLLQQRRDKDAVPSLWYPADSPRQSAIVRTRATEALVFLSGARKREELPPGKVALTREAEKYYRHQVSFLNPQAVTVWEWKKNRLESQTLSATQAEEYFALRFAGQALDLDPTSEAAQVVFLSVALEKGLERTGLDKPLDQGAPGVKELMRVVNPDLLLATLDRALTERRLPVIIGTIRALGDVGAVKALRPTSQREPALVVALSYPDRRVQLAAADALLRIPTTDPNPHAGRIVEVLRRALGTDAAPRVLVADANEFRANQLTQALKGVGYETVTFSKGRDSLRRLAVAADIDAIVLGVDSSRRFLPPGSPGQVKPPPQVVAPPDPVDHALPDPGMRSLLAQLRADIDFGLLPLLILIAPDATGAVPREFELSLDRLARHYRNTWVLPMTLKKDDLKRALAERIAEAMGQPFSPEERKANAALAMLWLRRLAVGEVRGYDVRPAEAAMAKALTSPELALLAIEAMGRLPGPNPQRELARVVLDDPNVQLKAAAARELASHLQRNGVALTSEIERLKELYEKTEDARLKANLALVLGSTYPDARQTGGRLLRYKPAPPPPPAKEK